MGFTLSECKAVATMMVIWGIYWYLKVYLTQKYFFRFNKSLHLFDTHCTFLPLFNPDFLQFVKLTKSGHHLFHDRASMGYGSIPGLTSQTSVHACLQRLNMMQIRPWRQTRNRPMPLTCSVVEQVMARFPNFYSLLKSQYLVLKGSVRFQHVQSFT